MSFFQDGPAMDPAYVNIRDESHWAGSKAYVEELWSSFRPLADQNCRSDARNHFLERFWEMYLARAFQVAGHQPEAAPKEGPDFLISARGKRIWVEATTAGPGEGDDAIPQFRYDVVQRVPEDQILLRLRTRISEKVKQWRNWSDKGIVAPEDAFIVAINGCRIRPALGDTTPPYVVKAVFPFGPEVVIVDVAAAEAVDSYYDFKVSSQ
jgi:hypothetical protein